MSDITSGLMQEAIKKDEKTFKPTSLSDSIENTLEKINKSVKDSKPIKDGYSNSLRMEGDLDVQESFTNYGFSNDTLNYPLWLALYNDSWVFRRAIDKPAQDEVNCGFALHGKEDYTKIYKAFDRNKSEITQLLMWGALFGGSIGVFMFEGISDEEMAKPLTRDKIKGQRFKLYVTDRWYGVAADTVNTVDDMKDVDFGKPKYYTITFANGKCITVHHSYVLRYEHRTAPKLVKQGQLQGWGYAEGSHILNELSRDDQLKAAIQTLVAKSNIEVIKMKGMRGIFMGTDKGNEEQLRKRLEMVNWGRSYNSLTFLDTDDSYEAHPFSGLAGLADILQQNMWMISSALEMQGVLFGDLKNGFANDQDAMDRYAITIRNRCEAYYRPVLYKFLKILFIVYDIPGAVDFTFNSINQKAENKDRVDSINTYASMLNTLVSNGVISKYQMAKSLQDFMEKDVITIQFTDVQLNRLKYEEEMEILGVYKKRGKEEPSFSEGNSFGGGEDFGGFDNVGEDTGGGEDFDLGGGEDFGGSEDVAENAE